MSWNRKHLTCIFPRFSISLCLYLLNVVTMRDMKFNSYAIVYSHEDGSDSTEVSLKFHSFIVKTNGGPEKGRFL